MNTIQIISIVVVVIILFFVNKLKRGSFVLGSLVLLVYLGYRVNLNMTVHSFIDVILYEISPLFLTHVLFYGFLKGAPPKDAFYAKMKVYGRALVIKNLRLGVSVLGAAGSGKTASVLYNLLVHFSIKNFTGIIHDYKDFELTKIAYPLFKERMVNFYVVAPHDPSRSHCVNPIAPAYMQKEADVNEMANVLAKNLTERKTSSTSSSGKFFEDAVESLLAGMIWKLKEDHPNFCTLPHLISIYTHFEINSLAMFIMSNPIAHLLANSFLLGLRSSRQTAGLLSTIAIAFKKLSSREAFALLRRDEIPLAINSRETRGVVSLINQPKYSKSYAPILSSIAHVMIKQMSVPDRDPSFIMVEEAPTLYIADMHEVPATLREFNVSTIMVMQDKVQGELIYGREANKAILSNLSYQFMGKANDPDTAKFYEQFFEIVKIKTQSRSSSLQLKFDTRITQSEKDVSKIRAHEFFKLKPGQFVSFSDGKERKVRFKLSKIKREMPPVIYDYTKEDLENNYQEIIREAKTIIKQYTFE